MQTLCAKGAVIDSCAFVGNGGAAGLEVGAQSKTKVDKVVATDNLGSGMHLFGIGISLRSSTVAGNGEHGVFVIEQGVHVTIANNVIVGNQADGVRFDVAQVPDRSIVASNLIAGNTGNGIDVLNETTNVSVAGNRLIGNRADGVKIASTEANFVRGNTAVGNGGSGFLPNAVTTVANNVATANRGR